MDIRSLLEEMVERNASDLHLTVGSPPQIRLDQKLVPVSDEKLTPVTAKALAYKILSEKQQKILELDLEVDLAFGIEGLSRFRGNIFFQRGSVASVIRRIPLQIPSIEQLKLPKICNSFVSKSKGLVLVTGPTGCGKSTSLAAIIDRINVERNVHIITIEDPIEYVHAHKKAIVNQREVLSDTQSFATALKYVLRQDPDVILVGEMRDLETISAALTAAETGHLVFATLHTNSATESINRIIDVFPPHQQGQVRAQLSMVLEAVVTQKLMPKRIGGGMILASEVMICSPAIRALIRESKVHEMYGILQVSRKFGMHTMNQSLMEMAQSGVISVDRAMSASSMPEELEKMFRRAGANVTSKVS